MKIIDQQKPPSNDLGGAMTDISFLLIVFFLVTAVFVTEEGISSVLPEVDSMPQLEPIENVIEVSIISETEYMINDQSFQELENVQRFVSSLLENKNNLIAILEVKSGVSYNAVIQVLSAIKEGGVSDFTIYSESSLYLEGEAEKFLLPLTVPELLQ